MVEVIFLLPNSKSTALQRHTSRAWRSNHYISLYVSVCVCCKSVFVRYTHRRETYVPKRNLESSQTQTSSTTVVVIVVGLASRSFWSFPSFLLLLCKALHKFTGLRGFCLSCLYVHPFHTPGFGIPWFVYAWFLLGFMRVTGTIVKDGIQIQPTSRSRISAAGTGQWQMEENVKEIPQQNKACCKSLNSRRQKCGCALTCRTYMVEVRRQILSIFLYRLKYVEGKMLSADEGHAVRCQLAYHRRNLPKPFSHKHSQPPLEAVWSDWWSSIQ